MYKSSLLELFSDDQKDKRGGIAATFEFPPDTDLKDVKAVAIKGISILHSIPNIKTGIDDSIEVSFDDGATTVEILAPQGWYSYTQLTSHLIAAIKAASPDGSHDVSFTLKPVTNKSEVSLANTASSKLIFYGSALFDYLGFDKIDQDVIELDPGDAVLSHKIPNLSGTRKLIICCSQLTSHTSVLRATGYNVIASIPISVNFGEKIQWEASDDAFVYYQGRAGSTMNKSLTLFIIDESGTNLMPYIDHSFNFLFKLYR